MNDYQLPIESPKERWDSVLKAQKKKKEDNHLVKFQEDIFKTLQGNQSLRRHLESGDVNLLDTPLTNINRVYQSIMRETRSSSSGEKILKKEFSDLVDLQPEEIVSPTRLAALAEWNRNESIRNLTSFFRAISTEEMPEEFAAREKFIKDWFKSHKKELEQVEELNLPFLNLTSIPNELKYFKNLKKLNLSDNAIASLPESFRKLTKLESLNLSHNKLTSIPMFSLDNLVFLDLSHNKITEMDSVSLMSVKNVQILNLNNNKIAEIPTFIQQLKNLRQLSLNRNQLTQLPPVLHRLRQLEVLSLERNRITKLPKMPPNLVTLNLRKNQLTLVENLGDMNKLENLDVSYNRLFVIPDAEGLAVKASHQDKPSCQERVGFATKRLFQKMEKFIFGE